ncbi:unnamed protein product [Amoebophrya sp. A120]|nr:unnamed protein product [Amoebophrya sp. A120]|eukprot:GSA120T00010949001.1
MRSSLLSLCLAVLSVSLLGVEALQLKTRVQKAKYEPDYENADAEDPDGITVEEEAQQGSMIDESTGEMDLDAVENADMDPVDSNVYPGEDLALEDANDEENNYQPGHDHVNVIHHGPMRYTNRDLMK